MSLSLSAERDRLQRQVEELEQSLSATHAELELLSSETDDESDGDTSEEKQEEARQSAAGLLAQREKIQKEIQNLENVLGPHSPVCMSDDDSSSSSDESELDLSPSAESCLQMNLVYQQVVQETLDQLETLLTHNHRQQKEMLSQLSGPIKESAREQPAPSSSCQQPITMYLGRFLKPYFKDKLTGLGPPANQETKEKSSRMTGCLDDKKVKIKRWESWQKTLLVHSVSRDSLRRLIQPKLSRVDYLTQKLSSAAEADKQQLRQQLDSLETEIDLLRRKKEEELIGNQYDEHDWQKICNVDFEGTRDAEDIRSFWQNFLHPSINKSRWSQEEVQQLKEVSKRHGERHWETIAAELGTGRTAFLCLQTFQRFVSDSLKRGSWTTAEDDLLRELVEKMRIGNFIPYTQMSYFMEGRDPSQLIYRWHQVLDPSLKKGFWTKEEDQLLLQAVSHYGEKNWWKIRFEVPGRTDSSCRDRYYDCLKAGTKRGPFDQQEKELLRQLVDKHGVGRWASIAAEIPHRFDAQCLREWRKLSKPAQAPPAQKMKKPKNPPKSHGGAKTKKKAGPAKRRIRGQLRKLKEDEEEENSEDEGMVVKYMDSDEDEEKQAQENVVEEEDMVEVETMEEEEKYTLPPLQEWVPVEKAQSITFLCFQPVELPSSGAAHNDVLVRSTVLGQFGLSVMIGPNPKALQWEKRHSNSTMMMVTADQLRSYLLRQAQKSKDRSSGPQRKARTDRQNPLGRVKDVGLCYELQAAVTPWIGNLLIQPKNRLTTADALRERGEKTPLSSTSVFLLLLQTMNVDAIGCKEIIEQRKNKVVSLAKPSPCSPIVRNLKTVAGMLQQRKAMKEAFDLQHKLILKQLQALQQQQQKQKLLKQPVCLQQLMLLQQQPPLRPPLMPSQNHPGILLQMPPNMHPRMSFPQAVFFRHPVTQPGPATIPLMHPSSLNVLPSASSSPPVEVVTSPLPAHRLSVPSVSVVPNTTSTCSTSVCQQAVPLAQNNQHVSLGSTVPSHHTDPSTSSSRAPPSALRQPQVAEDQATVCSSQSGVDLGRVGSDVGGACTGVGGASDNVIKEGQSQKAKALQEATEAKVEAKKEAASSPRQRAQIQNTNYPQTVDPIPPQAVVPVPPQVLVPVVPPPGLVSVPPQTLVSIPPQTLVPDPPQALFPVPPQALVPVPPQAIIPAVSVNSSPLPLNTTPACFDRTISSTQNISVAPPPSISTNQHASSSTSSLPAPFPNDHNYTIFNPSQYGSNSIQPSPESASNKPPKAGPNGKKRGRGEEQLSGMSGQNDQTVGGTGAGVIQEGKRVRNLTQRARALQEESQAKAEAKKKRTSSPQKKRSRKSCSKEEVVVKNKLVPQLPGVGLFPGQSMWVMTPGGLVQLAGALPPGLQLSGPLPTGAMPPGLQLAGAPSPGLQLAGPLPPRLQVSGPLPLAAPPPGLQLSGPLSTGASHPGLQLSGPPPTGTPPPSLQLSGPLPPGLQLSGPPPTGTPPPDMHLSGPPPTGTPPPGLQLSGPPGLQSARTPLPGLQLVMVPSAPLPPPSGNILNRQPVSSPQPHLPTTVSVLNQPCPLSAPPTCASKPLPPAFIPSFLPQPPPKLFLPYKGTVRADPAAPPPLQRVALQFDPSLMFLESQEAVRGWMSGRGGVVVPGVDVALPYLPPFVSSLNTLSALLRAKKALTKSSLQLLSQGSEPRHPPNKPTERASSLPPDLPDSTSDFTPVPSVSSDVLQEEDEEAELVAVTRQLVAERFSGNPAYQLMKARFLSCFTVPALLATMQPIGEKTVANEEEEKEEEEEELKKIKERGRQRRAERSLLLCGVSGAPANHFSGINTSTPGSDRTNTVPSNQHTQTGTSPSRETS